MFQIAADQTSLDKQRHQVKPTSSSHPRRNFQLLKLKPLKFISAQATLLTLLVLS